MPPTACLSMWGHPPHTRLAYIRPTLPVPVLLACPLCTRSDRLPAAHACMWLAALLSDRQAMYLYSCKLMEEKGEGNEERDRGDGGPSAIWR